MTNLLKSSNHLKVALVINFKIFKIKAITTMKRESNLAQSSFLQERKRVIPVKFSCSSNQSILLKITKCANSLIDIRFK